MVDAQATLVVDMNHVPHERCDVGTTTIIGYRIIWESTNSPFASGRVYFQGRPGYSVTNAQGWVFLSVFSNSVGNFSWPIQSIFSGTTQLSYEQNVPDPHVIFDRIKIDLISPSSRIGVGTEVPLIIDATYESDGKPFLGDVILNHENLTSSEIGSRVYEVEGIVDELYEMTKYDSNSIEIIYDRVNITLEKVDRRMGVGEEVDLNYTAIYEYDETQFFGAINYNASTVQNQAGYYKYVADSISDARYDVTSFISTSVGIIFDEVTITLEAKSLRIDVGADAKVTWDAVYAYDGRLFKGTVTLNRYDFISDHIGTKKYYVVNVEDPVHKLKSFSSNELEVAWDRISIDVYAKDERIDVGERAHVLWRGHYESDGANFSGYVEFSNGNFHRDSVGDISYKAVTVIDPEFGVNSFISDTLTVIWDRVNVKIDFPRRTNIGEEAEYSFEAYYEYDDTVFTGSISLGESLIRYEPGKHTFRVKSILDPKYGISEFDSNEAYSIWDEVNIVKKVGTVIPGRIRMEFDLTYETDNQPVESADFYVNGKKSREIKPGTYVRESVNILPIYSLKTELKNSGFQENYSFGIQFCFGNIGLLVAIAAAAAYTLTRGMI
jgi:predicted double-glycine peptidase